MTSIIGVIHPQYGSGTFISANWKTGVAVARFNDPPGRDPTKRGGVVPTAQVFLSTHYITVDGQTAIMRECPDCGMVTPHKLTEAGSACGICGKETRRLS
jgi:hypothetical protein